LSRLILLLALLLLAPAATAASPRPPVSIFYYPWYGTPALDGSYEHWQQGWHLPPSDIASNYYPTRGAYSSDNPRVVEAQMREIAAAGVDEVVSSWWGWGSIEDQRLTLVARTAQAFGLTVAVQLEPYDKRNAPYLERSAETVAADVTHLADLGITRLYVYGPFADVPDSTWAAINAAQPGLQILAQTANVTRAAAAGFDGVYTYDIVRYGSPSFDRLCRRARAANLVCAPSVGPGFEADRATGDPHAKPRLKGQTYDAMWRAAIRARADRVTITSYNEWHEGTQIEPASAAGSRLLAMSPTLQLRYETYDGAYGLHGREASKAYLARTAFWAKAYAAARAR
jgi:glycoprotein endo-alpha-1,2-mannosidase